MKPKFKAYYLEVIRLGLGITVREAQFCFRFCVPLDKVPAKVEELRAEGFSRGREPKPHTKHYGRLDPRVRRQRQKQAPKWAVPLGGYPGMQDDIRRMRAEDRGEIPKAPAQLEPRSEAMLRRDRLKALRKDWDPPDRYE